MSEYMVDVGLNVQPGQYMTTMGQAIAVTQEYAKVVDGIPGSIAKMSSGLVNLTNKLTGFSSVNTMAVDSAAAYQKALSGIEAQAAASGKSFTALEKTTKQFARNFSGGVGQAVQVVETLQKQGIKSEKQIETLGKAWIKLGAATGTSAAAMGAEFTQLSRTMGHSTENFTKLSDSLVSVTSKIGGSADSVVAFSKALAPVAATVGMNQTAVMGLSAAMSSMGEDGTRSANVMNKVLLDMNRAIRDGGPELKAYADLMGMTGERARDLMKSNPTEFFTRFAESLSKAGPNLSRSLEALGFDSVRDTRSLAALTRSGNLRSAVNAAREGFGDGSTDRAAAKALEGVTDQAEKLKESMSQVVANVGKPLLGIVQGQLGIANNIAGKAASVSEGEIPQVLSGVAGVAGGIGNIGMNALAVASGIALGRIGIRKFGESDFGQNIKAGFNAGRTGEQMGRAGSFMGRMGQNLGMGFGAPFMMPNGEPVTAMDRAMMATRRTASVGADVAARGVQGLYGNLFRSAEGRDPLRSQGGEMYRSQLADARQMLRQGQLGQATSQFFRSTGMYFGGLGQAGQSMSLTQALGSTAVGAGKMLGGAAASVGVGAGRMAMGLLGGPMGAALAGAGGLMYLQQRGNEASDRATSIKDSSMDINSAFNAFAEAAGLATRGLTSFNSQVEANSKQLAEQNTTMEKALSLSGDEVGTALSSGYKPAYELKGDDRSVEGITAQGQALLGARPSPQAVSAFLADVVNQTGEMTAKGVAEGLRATYGNGGQANFNYGAMARNIQAAGPSSLAVWDAFGGLNDTQKDMATMQAQAIMGMANMDREAFGGTRKYQAGSQTFEADAGTARAFAEAEKLYEAARRNGAGQGTAPVRSASSASLSGQIQAILGSDFDKYGFGLSGADSNAVNQGKTFMQAMEEAAAQGSDQARLFMAMRKDGTITSGGDVDLTRFRGEASVNEQGSRRLDKMFSTLADTSEGLSESLYGAERAARNAGKSLTDLYASGMPGVGKSSQNVLQYEMNGGDLDRRRAAETLLADALKATGGNQGLAAASLQLQRTQTQVDDDKQRAIDLALQLQEPRRQLANAGRLPTTDRISARRTAAVVGAMPFSTTDTSLNEMITEAQGQYYGAQAATIQDAVGFNLGYGALQTSIGAVRRSAGIGIGAISRDTALNEEYAREDYARQKKLAKRDKGIQERRADRDLGIQLDRARTDYDRQERYAYEDKGLQEFRAKRDFDKQMLHAEQDYQKARTRAVEDNNTAVFRAQRDFDKQMYRAQRDFDKSQERGLEDYNRTRLRAVEDFNKQMSRMVEDSAKQMYDPWKRISAQMVMDAGQLVTNLRDQQKAIEKQVSNLAEARSMGLSEQAIKALNLSDASNAQQLSRILEDMRGNNDFTGQINAAVAGKATASEALVKDQGNVNFSRAQEDFNTSMERMQQDFETGRARALADFSTSKSDTQTDFDQSVKDAEADFNRSLGRMDADYNTSVARANESFDTSMADMNQSFEISRTRAQEMFAQQVQYAKDDHARMLSDMNKDFNRAQNDAKDALDISITRMWEKARNAMSDAGAQAGAQIQSMMEQFFKVGQISPEDETAVKKSLQTIMASGRDPQSMGTEIQKQIQDGLDLAANGGVKLPQKLVDYFAGKGFVGVKDPSMSDAMAPKPGDKGFVGPVYDPSYKPPDPNQWLKDFQQDQPVMVPIEVDPKPSVKPHALMNMFDSKFWAEVGKIGGNIWQGLMEGFNTAFLQNPVTKWIGQMITDVKNALGIKSPSTVFMEIGQNIVYGLRDGIVGAITGVWENITSPIANLDIMGKVTTAFETAKTWISGLGGTIAGWVSTAWTSLTDSLPSLTGEGSIVSKVTNVFTNAKNWIEGLAGDGEDSVKHWIGTAWQNLTSKIPSLSDLMDNVKAAFGLGPLAKGEGIVQWIKGLKGDKEGGDNVKEWIGKAWEKILSGIPGIDEVHKAFGALVRGVYGVVGSLVDAWNALKVRIPIPGWASALPGPQNGKDALTFGTNNITRPSPPDWATAMAMGGIATKQMTALIGEAGYPEAVIPLNARGAEILAATMARYVSKGEAQGAMVSGYATPVVNNYQQTYDQRTQFTGPITVESQNPDDMAQKLQARARRQRLAQPIGGA